MTRLEEFYKLSNANDFFDFFDIAYDRDLLAAKRLHILKFFGAMVEKVEKSGQSDEKILEFYKFALMAIYKNYENGFSPSAADVWNIYENPSACLSCSTMSSCEPSKGSEHGTECGC